MAIFISYIKLFAMIGVGFTLWGTFINVLVKYDPPAYRDAIAKALAKFVLVLLVFIALSAFVILTD